MRWSHFNVESPSSGATYIVARISENNKCSTGLYTFCYIGNKFYWRSDKGDLFECHRSDHFCNVEDVIDSVEDRIKEDIETELQLRRFRN